MPQDYQIIAGRFVLRSLFRGSGGNWEGRFRDLRTGQVRRKSSGSKSKAHARRVLIEYLNRLAAVEDGGTVTRMPRDALREWLATLQIRPSTRVDYEAMRTRIVDSIGHLEVRQWTRADIERLLAEDIGQSPRTRAKYLTLIRAFLRWCVDVGYSRECVADRIPTPRVRGRSGRALRPDEADRLIEAAVVPHVRRAVIVGLSTGLRRGNVLRLTWRRVDVDERRIEIEPGESKSGVGYSAPISSRLAVELDDWRRGAEPGDRVIGRRVASIKTAWRSTVERSGVGPLRFHDLRHTFATWIASVAPHHVARAALGHSARSVTDRYLHAEWSQILDAVDRISWLNP